ncbi:MAG: hypothetical protein J6V42_06290 [Clostridia bacterium]|nr:hypothetical protein [Clostridia bacterium]
MAEKTNTAEGEKLVPLFVPKGLANDDPNEYICINGKRWVLPKGKTSEVPQFVKAEYDRSMRAQEALDAKSEEFLERGKEPTYKI